MSTRSCASGRHALRLCGVLAVVCLTAVWGLAAHLVRVTEISAEGAGAAAGRCQIVQIDAVQLASPQAPSGAAGSRDAAPRKSAPARGLLAVSSSGERPCAPRLLLSPTREEALTVPPVPQSMDGSAPGEAFWAWALSRGGTPGSSPPAAADALEAAGYVHAPRGPPLL